MSRERMRRLAGLRRYPPFVHGLFPTFYTTQSTSLDSKERSPTTYPLSVVFMLLISQSICGSFSMASLTLR